MMEENPGDSTEKWSSHDAVSGGGAAERFSPDAVSD